MRNDVHDEIAKLGGMTVGELQRKYATVFEEPTRSFNKPYLIKRIAWGLQAQSPHRPLARELPVVDVPPLRHIFMAEILNSP